MKKSISSIFKCISMEQPSSQRRIYVCVSVCVYGEVEGWANWKLWIAGINHVFHLEIFCLPAWSQPWNEKLLGQHECDRHVTRYGFILEIYNPVSKRLLGGRTRQRDELDWAILQQSLSYQIICVCNWLLKKCFLDLRVCILKQNKAGCCTRIEILSQGWKKIHAPKQQKYLHKKEILQ